MLINERARRRRADGAASLRVHSDSDGAHRGAGSTPVLGYAFGRSQARLNRSGLFFAATFVLLAAGAVYEWIFVIPAILAAQYTWNRARPVRGVLVDAGGIAVVEINVSSWHARSVLATLPLDAVLGAPAPADRRTTVRLGPDALTFGRHEYRRLVEAVRAGADSGPDLRLSDAA